MSEVATPASQKPKEAVAVTGELEVLIEFFQDKALILAVQFAGDQIEDILQIQLFLPGHSAQYPAYTWL